MSVVAYLGDKTPRELGFGTFRKTERPILSSTVDRVATVPYMHGAYDFGADLGPKPFNIECAFVARNSIQLQERVSTLAAYLLDGFGRPRTMPLIFTAQPDRRYMVRYSGSMPIDRVAGLGPFILPLIAYDPFAYSIYDLSEIDVDSMIMVDMDVPVDLTSTYSVSGPLAIPFTNFGSLNGAPVLEISGSFSNLSITIGGVETTYNTSMLGTLVLDFARKTARVGSTNVLRNTNRRFGALPVGDSIIVVNGSGLNCSLSIGLHAKYA
ncbi:distal tail protein Dit [Paenibacillus sp. FSL M7-0547]|uniref:distal tail protein Dit n=1 Tax=Paenibacillus sp. FSL M7-0547 TaxID=2954755 RepID=UPI0030F8A090